LIYRQTLKAEIDKVKRGKDPWVSCATQQNID
jgi:hypothetical protein